MKIGLKMGKSKLRKWGLAACALLVAVLIGCQPIGGFGFDDAILKQLEVVSQEQSGTLQADIDWNPQFLEKEAPDPASRKALEGLGKLSLEIRQAKSDASGRYWMSGALSAGGKAPIPFTLHVDNKAVRLDIEGASRPLAFELPSAADRMLSGSDVKIEREAMTEYARKLIRAAAPYFVRNLPNPSKLDVEQVNGNVHGDVIPLTKVHAELSGEQLGQLLVQYVDALAKDEAGFKDTLRAVLKWVSELPPELTQGITGQPLPPGLDSELTVQTIFNTLFPMLEQARDELAGMQNDDMWKQIFDKGIELKTDLYLDNSLHLRKTGTELTIAPAYFATPESPVRSIVIRSSSEIWNINGDVKVPDVDVPRNALKPDELEYMQPVQFLRLLDERSAAYDLLKNEWSIDDVSFEISGDDLLPPAGGSADAPKVRLRTALEGFDIGYAYGRRDQEIRFTDWATWQEIVLHIGSDQALVNGQTVKLKEPVVLRGSSAFIRADDLLPLLHATFTTEGNGGSSSLKVKREL